MFGLRVGGVLFPVVQAVEPSWGAWVGLWEHIVTGHFPLAFLCPEPPHGLICSATCSYHHEVLPKHMGPNLC